MPPSGRRCAPAGQRGLCSCPFDGGFAFSCPPDKGGVGGVDLMEFPFQGGCLYPLRDFFNKPLKGGVVLLSYLLIPNAEPRNRDFFNNPDEGAFVSKDGERISPSGANFALRYAASPLLRVRKAEPAPSEVEGACRRAATQGEAERRAGPHFVNPAAEEARSFASIFPFPGRILRNGDSFCFVIASGVNDIVSQTRYIPMVMRRLMRREWRTRWKIPNTRRN